MIRIVYALSVLSAIFLSGCDTTLPQTNPFSLSEANSIKIGYSKEDVLSKMSTPYSQSSFISGEVILTWIHYDRNTDGTTVWSQFNVKFSKENGGVSVIRYVPPCKYGDSSRRNALSCPLIVKKSGSTLETTVGKGMYLAE